jgi:hypothetical protein
MKRRTFLKLGSGALAGGMLGGCGGGGHDGGTVQPDPDPAPARAGMAAAPDSARPPCRRPRKAWPEHPGSAFPPMLASLTPDYSKGAPCRLNNWESTRSTIRRSG